MADTTPMYHPSALAPNGDVVRIDVPSDLVDRHAEQGWLKSEPKNLAIKEARAAQEKAAKAAQAPE